MDIDRYGIQISDASGFMDITFWGELGHEAAQLEIGSLVLFTNLFTFSQDEQIFVNARKDLQSQIYVLNTMKSLLYTPIIIEKRMLACIENEDFIITRVIVTEIAATHQKLGYTQFCHGLCRKPIHPSRHGWYCELCQMDTLSKITLFSCSCRIDDGIMNQWVEMLHSCTEEILGISAETWSSLEPSLQDRHLNSLKGIEILCGITRLSTKNAYRMDSVSRLN